MILRNTAVLAAAAAGCFGLVAPAMADTVDVTKANGTFIAGTGIPAGNFTGDSDAQTGASVWLKARSRDSGEALSIDGTTYHLSGGSAADPTKPWWVFDYQFSAGTAATPTTDYRLVLEFDKDPTAGTNYVVFDANTLTGTGLFGLINWSGTDGYFTNPGGGAWNNNTTPYVISQSWRPDFSFIDPAFNKNIGGTYEIRLTAYDVAGGLLAQTAITAQVDVVPLPSSALMGLGLLGGLGALSWHRRRKVSL